MKAKLRAQNQIKNWAAFPLHLGVMGSTFTPPRRGLFYAKPRRKHVSI